MAHHSDADRLIISGDLCHRGEPESYNWFRGQLERVDLPVLLTIGNHDDRANFRAAFPDHPVDENGFVQRTDDCGDHRIVVIDTNKPGAHEGQLCADRLAWLETQLRRARADDRPVFLVMHHHPMPIGLAGFDRIGLEDAAAFRRLIRRYRDGIDHIVFGHCHMILSGNVDGISCSAPRSINHQSWPDFADSSQLTFAALQPGYNVLLVDRGAVVVHTVEFAFDGEITRIPTTHDFSEKAGS